MKAIRLEATVQTPFSSIFSSISPAASRICPNVMGLFRASRLKAIVCVLFSLPSFVLLATRSLPRSLLELRLSLRSLDSVVVDTAVTRRSSSVELATSRNFRYHLLLLLLPETRARPLGGQGLLSSVVRKLCCLLCGGSPTILRLLILKTALCCCRARTVPRVQRIGRVPAP